MKHLTLLVGLVLLCIEQYCWGIPVGSSLKQEQLLYSYLGRLDTGSSACSERLGRWGVTGNLTVQMLEKSLVLQLHDLQTTLYNGYREDLKDSEHYENIPNEVNILEKPFVLHSDFSLSLTLNEPLWSVNFKRGLASNFHEVIEGVNQEKSVFGHCETKTQSKDGVMVKIINHNECDDVQLQHLTNVRAAPAPQGFNPINRKTVVHVKFAPGKAFPPESIHSESVLTYTSMPKVPYNQHILQHSELNLMSSSAEFDHIDISQLTEKKDIFFEYSDEITQGRHQYETDPQVLTQQYLQGYESFESFFERTPLENRKNSTEDPIEDMYMALYTMSEEKDITHLKEKIFSKNNDMMYRTFLSLLSYVGTEQAVNAINEIISRSEFHRMQLSGLQLLSTFPNYITDINDELVQNLEGMLELGNVKSETMRTAQILSFASVVSRGHKLKQLNEEKVLKYRTLYFDKFSASEDYETKFNYLLGLINMAEALSTEFQISIITNSTLPADLRSLAIVGFKNTLKTTAVEKLYDIFWPVVLNDEEDFDVRINCLDLLLSANLTEDQFYSIVQQSKKYLKHDLRSKHLANYVITTIESIQNKTAFREPLSDLASQVIQNKEFPVYPRAYWHTGNYRLSYSDVDSNLGAYVQARLIGTPGIGTVSSLQLSYNQFDWSFDTGVYSIYVKVQGICEKSFRNDFFQAMSENGAFPTGLPKLLDIIKKYNYKMKDMSSKISSDIVIFIDDKVVFAKTINEHNNAEREIEHFYQELIFAGFFLSFPLLDYIQMPSLLGTPLRISNDMQSIQKLVYPEYYFSFRSSWYFQTWLESYNPILDTSVSSFKYYGDENSVRARVSLSLSDMELAWVTKNDTFNWVSAKLIGTDVDEKLLHKFCPHCEGVTEVPTNLDTDNRMQNYTYLGAKYNYSKEQHEDMRKHREFFLTVKDVHQTNTDSVPFAHGLMVPIHTYRHNYYLKPELSRTSYRSVEAQEGGVRTRVIGVHKSEKLSSTVDPYVDTHENYTLTVVTKDLKPYFVKEDKLLSYWEFNYESKSTHNYTDENGKPKVKYTTNVYWGENNVNDFSEEYGGFQVCFSRAELFPPASPNRFQISPPEDASALTILIQENKTNDTIWTHCKEDMKTILKEVYTNQEDHTKQILESSFYKQCLEESKELKYTPATNSCIAAYAAMSRYDKYTANMELENITDMNSEGLDSNAFMTYETVDEDKLKFSLFLQPFNRRTLNLNESHFEQTLYFPYKSRNPVAEAHKDQDNFKFRRSCNISPQEIKTFTDNHIPNTDKNKQIALVECNSHSQRLVEFQKVNNHRIDVGFTSRKHTIVATADGSKVKVTLNGEELKDSVLNLDTQEKISVRFLDENAVYIADDFIGIYYNTEFINIKTTPMYKLMSCGLCDE